MKVIVTTTIVQAFDLEPDDLEENTPHDRPMTAEDVRTVAEAFARTLTGVEVHRSVLVTPQGDVAAYVAEAQARRQELEDEV